MTNKVMTQLKDGRWVPAQPVPYYRDVRSFWIKVWHSILILSFIFRKNRDKLNDDLDKKIDKKWMVPVEPYTDKEGKWHTF